MSSTRQIIDAAIDGNKVMVFSKTYCPYCTQAKSAISKLNVPFHVIELDVSHFIL
jgi:glutaredoxin 3